MLAASNVQRAYEDVNPWLLTTPASPHLAARHDGVTIGTDESSTAHRRLAAASDLVLVEGAGGWLAPISSVATMADIAEKLALPVIFVVGLRLGCLNHALLTREAIRSQRFAVRRLDRQQDAQRKCRWRTPISTRSRAALVAMASAAASCPSASGWMLEVRPRCRGMSPASAPAWAVEAANKLVSA